MTYSVVCGDSANRNDSGLIEALFYLHRATHTHTHTAFRGGSIIFIQDTQELVQQELLISFGYSQGGCGGSFFS